SKEGAILGVHVVMQDITEQKLALLQQEQYLRELEAKNRELDQIAIRDPLTGLYNRRFFDEGLNREWQRFQRSGEAFTVIILDVDHLKKINDLYGHESGDHALQQVGAMLQMSLRETDMVARVGGDEFAALLPRTDAGSAQAVMTKLQESAKKLRLVSVPRPIPITVSLGASTVPGFPPVSSPAELLRVADKRMYEAKRLTSSRQTDTR
ncbi:MAG: GGDEF domain-containing protein, partial [Nitrospirales bacterium]